MSEVEVFYQRISSKCQNPLIPWAELNPMLQMMWVQLVNQTINLIHESSKHE